MLPLQKSDGSVWSIETIDWDSPDPHSTRKIGVSKVSVAQRAQRGQSWALGQLYGVASPGLINVNHIFQGLRRPMSVNGDKEADRRKLVFTWRANRDARITREGELVYGGIPVGTVFFVLVSPNDMPDRFPEIFGWAEQWGWLDKHQSVEGAPIDFETRYDSRIWTRQ